jgi:nitrile hydratase
MDGIHDLGGKTGHGAVVREADEPVFHCRWEAKVFAIQGAAKKAGAWHNSDRFRHLVERIDPEAYLTHGYYGRWLGGIETGLVEAGIVSEADINRRVRELGGDLSDLIAARPRSEPDPLGEKPVASGAKREVSDPSFHVGQRVRTSTEVKPGHTRLPAYARDKTGIILMHHKGWVFPDTNAHGQGEDPQHLYTVQFTSRELWGSDTENVKISLDLFEPYLTIA